MILSISVTVIAVCALLWTVFGTAALIKGLKLASNASKMLEEWNVLLAETAAETKELAKSGRKLAERAERSLTRVEPALDVLYGAGKVAGEWSRSWRKIRLPLNRTAVPTAAVPDRPSSTISEAAAQFAAAGVRLWQENGNRQQRRKTAIIKRSDRMAKVKGKDFAVGAVVGGVLGAVTALLFAPKPGKELRSDISNQVHGAVEKTQELAKTVGSHTSEWVDKAKDAGSAALDEIRSWRSKRDASVSDVTETGEAEEIDEKAAISRLDDSIDFVQEAENI
ncbi:YtxH domain-containing protein [Gorillibacterium massiliense]|uniref:YtxH domain-containing protein n=1 Tax=Gorillibacterium massiliense TaxID=1280390 RepID=UPI0004B4C344|nr:YtxH domain-containing protein [Gorillibacterium massiliense]